MEKTTIKKDSDYKTLQLLEELLNHEQLLSKKCSSYSNTIFDSELKNICYNTGKVHEENYRLLLSYLNS
ncbi:hypothetical protein [Proteiniborus sp. MB09-C3]|uniref:hypothetical protein n=1 Tax=Proteiniborus sp. MB09-C3 TaxID=3050072 RepID=UPI002553F220|nr:hypothetical protein [Proteiniborus sp. MB09-C3]WIV11955.1 hypothetical protein QO263_17955 [Proteiniborus sp. MB09-C3]